VHRWPQTRLIAAFAGAYYLAPAVLFTTAWALS